MGRGGMQKYIDKRRPSAFKIQITSMVDMFVLLLIFLLMNYSADPIVITAGKDVTLPQSTSDTSPDADLSVKLVVGKSGIYIDEERIIEFKDGRLPASAVDSADPSNLPELFNALDKLAEQTKAQATNQPTATAQTPAEKPKDFEGRVLMQADQEMPYDLLKKVMYTSMMAGFSDVRLAVLGQ